MQRVLAAAHGRLGRGRWRSVAVDDDGHRALFPAAKAAGIERLVYTSSYGAALDHPIDFFRTKHDVEQALAASGRPHAIPRPTAFMEQHVHLFNGKALPDKGKAQLIGPGTKPRNFVAATDVAQAEVRALLEDPPPFRGLAIGGLGHYGNTQVTELYAREAGIPARIGCLPAGVARVIASLAALLHPGVARVLRLSTLPDDAYSEHFYGTAALEREHGVTLTTVEQSVRERVAESLARG